MVLIVVRGEAATVDPVRFASWDSALEALFDREACIRRHDSVRNFGKLFHDAVGATELCDFTFGEVRALVVVFGSSVSGGAPDGDDDLTGQADERLAPVVECEAIVLDHGDDDELRERIVNTGLLHTS